jgi:hypothetical protein
MKAPQALKYVGIYLANRMNPVPHQAFHRNSYREFMVIPLLPMGKM